MQRCPGIWRRSRQRCLPTLRHTQTPAPQTSHSNSSRLTPRRGRVPPSSSSANWLGALQLVFLLHRVRCRHMHLRSQQRYNKAQPAPHPRVHSRHACSSGYV